LAAREQSPGDSRARILIENAVKSFDSRVVLDVPKLVLGEHPIEGLIGPNGAGKTTLLRLIMHSISLDRGSVTLLDGPEPTSGHNVVLSRMSSDKIARLGVVKSNQVIQDFAPLTVYDSLLLALAKREDERPYRILSERRLWSSHADEVWDYLDRFGFDRLAGFAKAAGEKKLLDIIRCLLLKPRVLLLDEPTAGLPGEIRDRVMSYVKELATQGQVSVVIIEHDLSVIWSMSDFVHFMAMGNVVLQGEPEFVRQHDTVVEKYLGAGHARR
jgi:ABC-type branched-subunit amino acid transport system ATPase component